MHGKSITINTSITISRVRAWGWKILVSSSKKRIMAIILIIITIVSLVLFVSGVMNQFWFWVIVIAIAFIAYKIIPKLK